MGGTQDNGTQSGISAFNQNKRFHTFFDAQIEVNFRGTTPTFVSEMGWNYPAHFLQRERCVLEI